MRQIFHRYFVCLLAIIAIVSDARALPPAKSLATLQSVKVTTNSNGISVEIEASQPVALRSQLATDPDRLVLDFPNTQPAGDLHSKLLNQGDIKGFRVARYSANPPTTRVVVDFNAPQHYQIFPDGKTVIVRLMSDQQQGAAVKAHLDNVAYTPTPAQPVTKMEISYNRGRLSISAERASLSDILNEIHRQTGTDITIPAGAAQEQIVASVGPLPIREALASLLNGSRFNFVMVDSESEPGKLKSVILTYRGSTGISQPAVATPDQPGVQNQPDQQPGGDPQPEMQSQPEGQQEAPAPAQEAPPQQ
jgi:AMIN domain